MIQDHRHEVQADLGREGARIIIIVIKNRRVVKINVDGAARRILHQPHRHHLIGGINVEVVVVIIIIITKVVLQVVAVIIIKEEGGRTV